MKLHTALVGAFLIAMAGSVHAQSTTWKLAVSWPSSLPILNRSAEYFADNVRSMSDGRLVIEIVEPSEHKQPLGLFGAVVKGEFEMGYTTSHYYKDVVPAIDFFTATPFGLTASEHYAWMQTGGGQELMDSIFAKHGIVATSLGNTGIQMGGWYKNEIKTLKDFDGLRIRISGMPGTVLESFGAKIVHVGGSKIPEAFENDQIDAAEFVGPAIDQALDFKRFASHYYTPWHEPSVDLHLFINKSAFEGLSPDLQKIVRVAAQASVLRSLSIALSKNADAWQEMMKTNEVSITTFPPEVIAALQKQTDETFTSLGAADPESAKVIESLLAYKARIKPYLNISSAAYQRMSEDTANW